MQSQKLSNIEIMDGFQFRVEVEDYGKHLSDCPSPNRYFLVFKKASPALFQHLKVGQRYWLTDFFFNGFSKTFHSYRDNSPQGKTF